MSESLTIKQKSRLKKLDDILASTPSQMQVINFLIEHGYYLSRNTLEMDYYDHVDILAWDYNRAKEETKRTGLKTVFGKAIDVKVVRSFPRGYPVNRILFEERDSSGHDGWGLGETHNRYIAIVKGEGWNFESKDFHMDYETPEDVAGHFTEIRQRIIDHFAGHRDMLRHDFYLFDLASLREYYEANKVTLEVYRGRESDICRKISLPDYIRAGYGYDFYKYENGMWTHTADGSIGAKDSQPTIIGPDSKNFANIKKIDEFEEKDYSNQQKTYRNGETIDYGDLIDSSFAAWARELARKSRQYMKEHEAEYEAIMQEAKKDLAKWKRHLDKVWADYHDEVTIKEMEFTEEDIRHGEEFVTSFRRALGLE